MKIIFFTILMIAAFAATRAQEATPVCHETETHDEKIMLSDENTPVKEEPMYRNIYIEFLGASTLIGISYDSRIKPGSPFGYRAGIAYASGSSSFLGLLTDKMHCLTVPLAFNCILGKRKSKFEVSFGINMGVYSVEEYYFYDDEGKPSILFPSYVKKETRNIFGYYFFSDIGYRYQRKSGFMLRVGVNPSFNFGGRNGIGKSPLLYPYLSLGYTL